MRLFSGAAALSAALLLATAANSAVWEDTREWSPEWEKRYSSWVERFWSADAAHREDDPDLFGLELDCADAVYTMRIIFAQRNQLPFAINDPRGRRKLLSNRSTAWDKIRQRFVVEDDDTGKMRVVKGDYLTDRQKLRRFIDDVNTFTTTQSLARDTFPIPLSDLRPGDIYLVPGSHAFIIKDVGPTGAITTLSASSPRAWRRMARVEDFPSYVPKDRSKRDGYRRFKPISHMKTKASKVPGASLEQWKVAKEFKGDWAAFTLATQDALARYEESPSARALRRLDAVCDYAVERVSYVDEAISHLERIGMEGRSCMRFGEYAEYSTPSRDKRLRGMFEVLRVEMERDSWNTLRPDLRARIGAIFAPSLYPQSTSVGLETCAIPVDYLGGKNLTLAELWQGLESGLVSHDPHAPREFRWGYGGEKWRPTCRSARGG
ncbi:MAG: hypothetical protein AAFU68_05295 [Pseudomonadota bacterium]